jgi:L-seryl-tRNA(Ser) seleniumtransferase
VPNPYIALGADLVAYSGGKIIRGPQTAGLLVGRRDLVRAAWANSAPHHAFGRALKVSKEEIVGMLRAVEVWRSGRDVQADMREWERWFTEMREELAPVKGLKTQLRGPARGGPFPTLNLSWDPQVIGLTAGEVGRKLLEGEPRIMSHAQGEGRSFAIRPVAMKPGEYKVVSRRLKEVFMAGGGAAPAKKALASPAADISGAWEVEVQYEVGSARHKLFLNASGNRVKGAHQGWALRGDLTGEVSGDRVMLRSVLPVEGTRLSYTFRGALAGEEIAGEVELGEYGKGKFRARRHNV